MRNRVCPKCNASEIYSNAGSTTITKNRLLYDSSGLNSLPLSVYMCMNCGYLEYYVPYKEQRERVARNWKLVN